MNQDHSPPFLSVPVFHLSFAIKEKEPRIGDTVEFHDGRGRLVVEERMPLLHTTVILEICESSASAVGTTLNLNIIIRRMCFSTILAFQRYNALERGIPAFGCVR